MSTTIPDADEQIRDLLKELEEVTPPLLADAVRRSLILACVKGWTDRETYLHGNVHRLRKAYLNAALTLVPVGCAWQIGQPEEGSWGAYAGVGPEEPKDDWAFSDCGGVDSPPCKSVEAAVCWAALKFLMQREGA
jgi:hypothetical protein